MDPREGRILRPLRINRPGSPSRDGQSVLHVPERVPEHVVAPDRGSPPQTRYAADARRQLRQAFEDLGAAMEATFGHKEGCAMQTTETDCACGLTGFNRYLDR